MDVVRAAENMLTVMRKCERTKDIDETAQRDELGLTLEHCGWMLNEIVVGNVTGEKAHRWLGYAQGVLCANGVADLDSCKYANLFS